MLTLKTFGKSIDEIKSLLKLKNIVFNDNQIFFRLESLNDVKIIINEREFDKTAELVSVLNEFIYATEDVSIYEQLSYCMMLHKKKINIFEQVSCGSFTAGLLSNADVHKYLEESLIVTDILKWNSVFDIDIKDLKDNNSISERNAYFIISKIAEKSVADYIVATIGVTEEKDSLNANIIQPKGLTYIAIKDQKGIDIFKYNYKNLSQLDLQTIVSKHLCFMLLNKIKHQY